MTRQNLALVGPDDPVERIMVRPVATVTDDAMLREVVEVLAANEIGAIGVVRNDHVLGIVSERDVVRQLAQDGDFEHTRAADIMSTELLTVRPDELIIQAAQRLNAAAVRHLPVLHDGGELLGFISVRDLLAVLVAAIPFAADAPSSVRAPAGS